MPHKLLFRSKRVRLKNHDSPDERSRISRALPTSTNAALGSQRYSVRFGSGHVQVLFSVVMNNGSLECPDSVFDGEMMKDGSWLVPVAVVSGVVGILGMILGISLHLDKKRRQQWLEVATVHGFEYLTVYPDELDGIVGSSRLMTTGRQRAWTNIFRRQVDSLGVTFCDYRYTTGQGKNTKIFQQTVVLFHSPSINVPTFEIKPEGWFSRLGEMLGGQDIDFADSPEFSKKYVLTGNDEAAIRTFLRPDTLQLLAGLKNLCLEVRPGSVMFWFDRRRISPLEFNTAFEQAFGVYTAMTRTA